MNVLATLNVVDYIILVIIVISALYSLLRGFVKEILSLVVWVAAFYVANHYSNDVMSLFTFIHDAFLRISFSAVVLFLVTLLIGSFISFLICRFLNYTGLGGIERVLGMVFGLLRGVLVVAAIIFLLKTYTPVSNLEVWKQSVMVPHFYSLLEIIFEYFRAHNGFFMNTQTLLFSR